MRSSVRVVHGLVSGIDPGDKLEERHRVDMLRSLESTDEVFRRVEPATPDRHLVSYVVPVDGADGSTLLVDHVNAGLWLPPGGHVEPDELPQVRGEGGPVGIPQPGLCGRASTKRASSRMRVT